MTDGLKPEIQSVELVQEYDDDPDLSWLEDESNYAGLPAEDAAKYLAQDAERLADYGTGWNMVGVYAVAKLRFATPQGGWQSPFTVRTAGLWGIESDSDEAHFAEVGAEELFELADMLKALGIDPAEVAEAIERAA